MAILLCFCNMAHTALLMYLLFVPGPEHTAADRVLLGICVFCVFFCVYDF